VRGNRVQLPPAIDGTTSVGFLSHAEPLSPVGSEHDCKIEAVLGIEVGRTGAGPGVPKVSCAFVAVMLARNLIAGSVSTVA
jgi:hypothetical protein